MSDDTFADAKTRQTKLHAESLIVIPRIQYEALIAAVEASAALERDVRRDANPSGWFKAMAEMFETLAALRASGIPEGE